MYCVNKVCLIKESYTVQYLITITLKEYIGRLCNSKEYTELGYTQSVSYPCQCTHHILEVDRIHPLCVEASLAHSLHTLVWQSPQSHKEVVVESKTHI